MTADDALWNLQFVLNALVLNALSNAAGQLAVGVRGDVYSHADLQTVSARVAAAVSASRSALGQAAVRRTGVHGGGVARPPDPSARCAADVAARRDDQLASPFLELVPLRPSAGISGVGGGGDGDGGGGGGAAAFAGNDDGGPATADGGSAAVGSDVGDDTGVIDSDDSFSMASAPAADAGEDAAADAVAEALGLDAYGEDANEEADGFFELPAGQNSKKARVG